MHLSTHSNHLIDSSLIIDFGDWFSIERESIKSSIIEALNYASVW